MQAKLLGNRCSTVGRNIFLSSAFRLALELIQPFVILIIGVFFLGGGGLIYLTVHLCPVPWLRQFPLLRGFMLTEDQLRSEMCTATYWIDS
jgi:hypothetical protein